MITAICLMNMYYTEWIYKWVSYVQSGLYTNGLWPISMFETMLEKLSIFHFWGCPTYVMKKKFQKLGVKFSNWDPESLIGMSKGFTNMELTQVGLVMKLLNS